MIKCNFQDRLSYAFVEQLINTFDELAKSLDATCLKHRTVSRELATLAEDGWKEFNLFLSKSFNALWFSDRSLLEKCKPDDKIYFGLTFRGEDICNLCDRLESSSNLSQEQLTHIKTVSRNLQPNDATVQSEFSLKLLELISRDRLESDRPQPDPELSIATEETTHASMWICQPIENALQQQIKQEQLLYRVTTQIRQSLELPVILSTAVEEVRRCLDVDRLLIYEVQKHPTSQNLQQELNHPSQFNADNQTQSSKISGIARYEARSSEEIPSILELDIEDELVDRLELQNPDLNQFPLSIDDITRFYEDRINVLNFFKKTQVKSELLVPIVVEEDLWGLLIAHQCHHHRQWDENDRQFLGDLAEHLAIAIHQALLYRQLQLQKQLLEERFKHQTQNLRDALIAAEAASRSKSEFLAAMSHELRTPLTCVIGMSSTLLRWSFGQLSEKQRHYLHTIHDSGEHLLELINDILDLSQLEAGKAVLNLQEISVVDLVQQMVVRMREKAQTAEITLNTEFQISAETDRAIADSRRIEQIIYNLLSNAIKFTPSGGQVTVRVWRDDRTTILQVADTGVGIPREHQPVIFNKFQQLDSSYHRNYEGTGLGLALTKQLVELHGGWIDVTSQVGVGSVFTVRLPIKELKSHRPSHQIRQKKSDRTPLAGIVLIQEEEDTATNVCDVLTSAGYQVVWMIDGSNALSSIEVLEPKLVAIDTRLSDINPCEIIEALRQNSRMEPLKILMLVTDPIPESLRAFWEAGADDYLVNPIESQSLLRKIQSLLQN